MGRPVARREHHCCRSHPPSAQKALVLSSRHGPTTRPTRVPLPIQERTRCMRNLRNKVSCPLPSKRDQSFTLASLTRVNKDKATADRAYEEPQPEGIDEVSCQLPLEKGISALHWSRPVQDQHTIPGETHTRCEHARGVQKNSSIDVQSSSTIRRASPRTCLEFTGTAALVSALRAMRGV